MGWIPSAGRGDVYVDVPGSWLADSVITIASWVVVVGDLDEIKELRITWIGMVRRYLERHGGDIKSIPLSAGLTLHIDDGQRV